MSQRIRYLKESPCYKCSRAKDCVYKIARSPSLMEIADNVMGRADFDYHNCSIFRSIILNEIAWTAIEDMQEDYIKKRQKQKEN